MYGIVKDGSNFIIVDFKCLTGIEANIFRFSSYIYATPTTTKNVTERNHFAKVDIHKFVFTYADTIKYIESEWEKASYNMRSSDVMRGEIVLTIKSTDKLIRTIDDRFLWITGDSRGAYLENPASYMYKVVS